MLEQNKEQFDYLGITQWHQAGYTGHGLRIGVLDLGYNKEHSPFNDVITVGRAGNSSLNRTHGLSVVSIIKQILPNATIIYGEGSMAVNDVLRQKPDLITMSLSVNSVAAIARLEQVALQNPLIPIITSGGNVDVEGVTLPAHLDSWIAIGAVHFDRNGNHMAANYSSLGGEIEFSAFTNLRVHGYNNTTRLLGGTSCAAPVFAGTLGLIMSSMRRKIPVTALRNSIIKYTENLGAPGRDVTYGHGVLKLPKPGSVR